MCVRRANCIDPNYSTIATRSIVGCARYNHLTLGGRRVLATRFVTDAGRSGSPAAKLAPRITPIRNAGRAAVEQLYAHASMLGCEL